MSESDEVTSGTDLELVLGEVAECILHSESVSNDSFVATCSAAGIGSACREMLDAFEVEHDHLIASVSHFMSNMRNQVALHERKLTSGSVDIPSAFLLDDGTWSRSTIAPCELQRSTSSSGPLHPEVQNKHSDIAIREDVHRVFQKAQLQSLTSFTFLGSWRSVPWIKRSIDILRGVLAQSREFVLRRRLKWTWLERVVEHSAFKAMMFSVVVANTLCMAMESSHDVKHTFARFDAARDSDVRPPRDGGIGSWMVTLDTLFICMYSFEVFLRMLAWEGTFFLGPQSYWNCFDFFIVLTAVTERVFLKNVIANPSVFRLLRLLRLARSFRSVRMLQFAPWLYSLQLLLVCIKNSLAALLWSSMLIGLLVFVFAMIFVTGVSTYVENAAQGDAHVEVLRTHFNSLPSAMVTLFIAFLGEVEFRDLIEVLFEVHPAYCATFFLFILFVALALTNIISGIFVTETFEMAQQDREIRQRGVQVRAKKNLKMLRMLFREMDSTGTGRLGREDFDASCQSAEVQSLFSFFKFDIVDAGSFFTLLDVDGDGYVDIEEFIVGCLRMYGKSNAIDMEINVHETRAIASRVEDGLMSVLNREQALEGGLEEILQTVSGIAKVLHANARLAAMSCNEVIMLGD